MKVTRFNHVGLNAAGRHDEALAFYGEFLGMSEHERSGAATFVNGFWSGTDVGPIVHMVTDPPVEGLEMPNDTHLSLYVEDIDAAVAEIKARCETVVHIGEGDKQIIWFKDPAGNTLECQQDPDLVSKGLGRSGRND